ncbi:MAG: glycosyltransferase family 87 protein [bacterium]|nr:glycosyltransferase family 87 protein [bacterium]
MKYALIIAIIAASIGFGFDAYHTAHFGGVDLRNRVTAARVADELKQDPYTFKWNESLSDRYLDPADNTAIPVSRVTTPPTVLLFHNIISRLSYHAQRWIWFFFQWGCLLGSIYLLGKISLQPRVIWLTGLLFSLTEFWRLHVERGQIYILYVFLFTLSLYLYNTKKPRLTGGQAVSGPPVASLAHVSMSGLLFGYLISLRPPFVLGLLPFIFQKQYRFVSYAFIGLMASALITTIFIPYWGGYIHTTQFQTAMRSDPYTNFKPVGIPSAEGMDIHDFLGVPGSDASLQYIMRGAFNAWPTTQTLTTLLIIGIISLSLIYIRKEKQGDVFYWAILLVIFTDYFIPAPKWAYANVLWLIPFGLMLKENIPVIPVIIALLGLSIRAILLTIPPFSLLGDFIILISLFIYAIRRTYYQR